MIQLDAVFQSGLWLETSILGEVSVLGSKNDLLNADLQITCI